MNSLNKRIALAIISGPVGKTPKDVTYSFVFDEACRLARRGIDVHIARSKFERGDEISYGIRFHGIERRIDTRALHLLIKNVPVYPPISLLRRPTSPYWENLYATNVVKVVKNTDADLIHAHFAYPEGFVGLLVKKEAKKPLIVTCHGGDVNVVPSVNYGVRLSKGCDALVRRVLRDADAIICVSNDLRRKVLKLGAPPEKTLVVFNAVDLNMFRPPELSELPEMDKIKKLYGVNEDEFLILNARHLKPVYGLEYIIYAAKIVSRQIPNAKFIIAGEGDLRKKLINMIHNLGLEGNVQLIGNMPRYLMPKLMRASSLYVNTSLADGMSPSMLEACASGVPLVSFNVGGAVDIIDDGVNGFLVPPGDFKGFASKIVYLLQNEDILERMKIMARRIAEERFDINKKIDRIVTIYKRTVGY